jgi:hypothetical protein
MILPSYLFNEEKVENMAEMSLKTHPNKWSMRL